MKRSISAVQVAKLLLPAVLIVSGACLCGYAGPLCAQDAAAVSAPRVAPTAMTAEQAALRMMEIGRLRAERRARIEYPTAADTRFFHNSATETGRLLDILRTRGDAWSAVTPLSDGSYDPGYACVCAVLSSGGIDGLDYPGTPEQAVGRLMYVAKRQVELWQRPPGLTSDAEKAWLEHADSEIARLQHALAAISRPALPALKAAMPRAEVHQCDVLVASVGRIGRPALPFVRQWIDETTDDNERIPLVHAVYQISGEEAVSLLVDVAAEEAYPESAREAQMLLGFHVIRRAIPPNVVRAEVDLVSSGRPGPRSFARWVSVPATERTDAVANGFRKVLAGEVEAPRYEGTLMPAKINLCHSYLLAFSYIGEPATPRLRQERAAAAGNPEAEKWWTLALGYAGDREVAEAVKAVILNDPDPYVRWSAVTAYLLSMKSEARPLLEALLTDPTTHPGIYSWRPIDPYIIRQVAREDLARLDEYAQTGSFGQVGPFNWPYADKPTSPEAAASSPQAASGIMTAEQAAAKIIEIGRLRAERRARITCPTAEDTRFFHNTATQTRELLKAWRARGDFSHSVREAEDGPYDPGCAYLAAVAELSRSDGLDFAGTPEQAVGRLMYLLKRKAELSQQPPGRATDAQKAWLKNAELEITGLQRALAAMSRPALPALRVAMQRGTIRQREALVPTIGDFGRPALPFLKQWVAETTDDEARISLVYIACRLPGDEATSLLVDMAAEERCPGSAHEAYMLLGERIIRRPIPPNMLEAETEWIKAGQGNPRAFARWLSVPATDRGDAIAEGLRKILAGEVEVPRYGGAVMPDKINRCRSYMLAFSDIGEPAVPRLRTEKAAAAANPEAEKWWTLALGYAGDDQVAEDVKSIALDDPEKYIRWSAVTSYMLSAKLNARPFLESLLTDPTEFPDHSGTVMPGRPLTRLMIAETAKGNISHLNDYARTGSFDGVGPVK